MKFSKLLENIDNEKNAFVLGMIYGWTLLDKNNKYIFAYSNYKTGSNIEKIFNNKINFEEYYLKHQLKLKKFLGDEFEIKLNSEIKKNYEFTKKMNLGISIIFENDIKNDNGIDEELNILNKIEKELIETSENSKRFFLIGLMDSRGSLDFTANFISIDIADKNKPNIVRKKLNKFNDLLGLNFNYNPRILQKNSDRKNDQFRINLNYYIGKYGFLNPFKIEYYKKVNKNYKENSNKFIFIDEKYSKIILKKINNSSKNLKINDLHQKLNEEKISNEEKEKIINIYRKENNLFFDTDDEILYSNQNIKNSAKIQANYSCFFENHKTFEAKSNNKNYVEAHHLIPFSKRNKFDTSIDIEENIICLCPNCHRKIHLGINRDIEKMLKILLDKRKVDLKNNGIDINENILKKFYGIS